MPPQGEYSYTPLSMYIYLPGKSHDNICHNRTSGVSRQLARKQLLQSLLVTLWQYNAKMILRHYALCPENGLDLFSFKVVL